MSIIEQLEGQVRNLSAAELKAFRDWFVQYDAARWDDQIDDDAKNGKLAALASRALREHEMGRSTEL